MTQVGGTFSVVRLLLIGTLGPLLLLNVGVPQGAAWLLDMSTWKFVSMGAAPDWDETDGLLWSRIPGADQFQARLKSYYAIYCSNPGKNGVAILP